MKKALLLLLLMFGLASCAVPGYDPPTWQHHGERHHSSQHHYGY